MVSSKWVAVLSIFALLAVAGCRSQTDASAVDAPSDCLIEPTVSPASATLHVGDTLRVSVSTKACANQTAPNLSPYVWSSSDPSVAKVDASSGLVLALGDGSVTIVATSAPDASVKGAMALRIVP